MSKSRRVTDYNAVAQNRITRTARWWLAPQGVTPRSKIISGVFLGVLLVALLFMFIWRPSSPEPTATPAATPQGTSPAAAPSSTQADSPEGSSTCKKQEAQEFSPEQVINASYS